MNKMKKKSKKGFTLIELIVVIAVLGILVLLAAPKFLGYTKDARIVQIKADIKAYETVVASKLVIGYEFAEDWDSVSKTEMETYRDDNSLMNKAGKIDSEYIFNNQYVEIPKDLKDVKTNLKGDFIMNSGGEIYYYEDGLKVKDKPKPGEGNSNPSEGNTEDKGPVVVIDNGDNDNDGLTNHQEKLLGTNPDNPDTDGDGLSDKEEVDLGTDPLKADTDDDGTNDKQEIELGTDPKDSKSKPLEFTLESKFQWVEAYGGYNAVGQSYPGYYKYLGTGEETVVIPNVINGTPITSYYKMFSRQDLDVKKIVSYNKNITSMKEMFFGAKAPTLTDWTFDVSELYTSNVTNMADMFNQADIKNLVGLEKFDTSKVEDMSTMFLSSQIKDINLSAFDTSNVKDMSHMFNSIKQSTLDLSKFDTSSVTTMYNMFDKAAATTIIGLEKFDTSNVTDMTRMFANTKMPTIDVSNFNTSKVTNMTGMFEKTLATSIVGLNKFNTTNVTSMAHMFLEAAVTTLDLNSFNTSNVTSMESMFEKSKVENLDLSTFNMSKVTSLSWFLSSATGVKTVVVRTQADFDKIKQSYPTSSIQFSIK